MMLSLLPTAVWARDTGSGDPQEAEDTAKLKPQSGEGGTPHETATSKELDLDDGSIVISASGYTQYKESDNMSEDSDDGNYTIKQTNNTTATTNTITVTGGDHTITLNGVNIDVSGMSVGVPCAFAIEGGEVTLVLADGSENTLKSGWINEDNPDTGISYSGLWVHTHEATGSSPVVSTRNHRNRLIPVIFFRNPQLFEILNFAVSSRLTT